jgi:2-polyprenyl-3-methyl-5-hydroxy-6-metoxy-1,4-benzoquinol methylase
MFKNPLNVIATPSQLTEREFTQNKFDRQWQLDPQQFDPERNCLERERLLRTLALLPESLDHLKAVDLGSGMGVLSKKLRDRGAAVDAVDIAKKALDALKEEIKIRPIADYVPKTKLEDETYDLVLCTDLIAHLPENAYRLLFSELARIIKPSGTLICSTPLDYRSEDALQRFAALAESEFDLEHWIFSYHLFYIHLKDFFEAPQRFVRAAKEPEYRQKQLEQRKGLSKGWFLLNSRQLPALFWRLVRSLSQPIAGLIGQSRSLLLALENVCRFLWADAGITHAILRAKRRSLEKIPEEERPIERKQKKQVWV